MTEGFSQKELRQISQLPKDIAALANEHKIDVLNAAEFWGEPDFPDGYIPESIEIYYGDKNEPSIFILHSKLYTYDISEIDNASKKISVLIDSQWAYIKVMNKILLNRLGGVILPQLMVDPSLLIESILKTYLKEKGE